MLWFMARPGWPPENSIKTLKAVLLMGKIVTLAQASNGGVVLTTASTTLARSLVICVASALATTDMWHPTAGVGLSLGLAVLHVGLLYLI